MNIFRTLPITFDALSSFLLIILKIHFMNIYIANLHFSISDTEIQQLFEQFGSVQSVNLMIDKKTKKSKGFAFVEMSNEKEALRAIDSCNHKEVRGRTLKVSIAK